MKVGDQIMRPPTMWGEVDQHKRRLPQKGTIISINQAHGHFTVCFDTPGGPTLETYRIVEGDPEAAAETEQAELRRARDRKRAAAKRRKDKT